MIRAVEKARRVAVKGCVASGKSVAAAMLIAWWIFSRYPAKVFFLAPTNRQVRVILWGELKALIKSSRLTLGGRLLETCEWRLPGDNWYAMGFSTDKPDRVHGIHGENVLVIVDESQGMRREIDDGIENVMADGQARLVRLMNPTTVTGEAYDAFHSKASVYEGISVPAHSTPNVRARKILVPGMITHDQVDEWAKTYGRGSNFFRSKVLAEFPTQEPDSLIPITDVEMRMMLPPPGHDKQSDFLHVGVDPARYGDDHSVIYPVVEGGSLKPVILKEADIMTVAKRAFAEGRGWGKVRFYVDVIGVGAGVADKLRELGADVVDVNVSENAYESDRFGNLRAEIYWIAREMIQPQNTKPFSLFHDLETQAQLASVKWKVDARGRIVLESKDHIRSRLGRSPDHADALVMALWGLTEGNSSGFDGPGGEDSMQSTERGYEIEGPIYDDGQMSDGIIDV